MKSEPILTLAVVVLLVGLSGGVCAGTYSGGTGEPNSPYRIETAEDLNDIGNHVEDFNKCFVMVNDINLAAYTGSEFNIINKKRTPESFTGIFDGNNHSILNFSYETQDQEYLGLFAYIHAGAVIKNLKIIDPNIKTVNSSHIGIIAGYIDENATLTNCYIYGGNISGTSQVGGLTGCNIGGAINNCYVVDVNISASGDQIGGLAGDNDGTITDCYVTGNVQGNYMVGGLAGNVSTGVFDKCFASGSVEGNYYVGGLIGNANMFSVKDSYAVADVVGGNDVGGLVGSALAGSVSRCYSAGNVSGTGYVGGLIGVGLELINENCFWDNNINPDVNGIGNASDPNVIGRSTAEMKKEITFTEVGWDFVGVWDIGEGQTYPFLRVYPAGDLNHDGIVNFKDIAILAGHWLEGTGP